MAQDFRSYFCSFMNLFEIAFAGVVVRLLAKPNEDSGAAQAFSIVLIWGRGILLLSVFKKMSALLLMIEEIIVDTLPSMVLWLLNLV